MKLFLLRIIIILCIIILFYYIKNFNYLLYLFNKFSIIQSVIQLWIIKWKTDNEKMHLCMWFCVYAWVCVCISVFERESEGVSDWDYKNKLNPASTIKWYCQTYFSTPILAIRCLTLPLTIFFWRNGIVMGFDFNA